MTFDDPNLVANAGLLLVATLVVRLRLEALMNDRVDLSDRVGGALPGGKVLTLVHALVAGGDTAAAEALPAELDHAKAADLSHQDFLERLLSVEVAAVDERRRASLARFASLPSPFTLADFDFSAQPSVDKKMIDELATLRFIEDATNVLLIGPPGVRKTMLAVALGHAAVAAACGPITRRPPNWPPGVIGRHWRAGGRRPCGSMPGHGC